jgi:hypothetical protein
MLSPRNTCHIDKVIILCCALAIGTLYAAGGGIVDPDSRGTIENIIDITAGGNFFDTALKVLWYILKFVRLVLN